MRIYYSKPFYWEDIILTVVLGIALIWCVISAAACGDTAAAFYRDTETEQLDTDTEQRDTETEQLDTGTEQLDTETETSKPKFCPWKCVPPDSDPKHTCDNYVFPQEPESVWNPFFDCPNGTDKCCQPIGANEPWALDVYCYDKGDFICMDCGPKTAVRAYCYNASGRCCKE